MKYERIVSGVFKSRPNRFIAHVEIDNKVEVVHVKNTGRCAELLTTDATVYLQKTDNPERKTQWDLITVEKGSRLVNMDSQIPNYVVKEWLEKGDFIPGITFIKSEYTYGDSRIDLYVEAGERKILIEVKGVTLERDNVVLFPDAPSERAVKHVKELQKAVKEGYEAYVFFVIQMKGVSYFTPNKITHLELADALVGARNSGVNVIAYDCNVTKDSITLQDEVPVVLGAPTLYEMRESLVQWYQVNQRVLPWRQSATAYEVWVSEIMLQQTRVEAVKPFYARFLEALPTVEDLANVEEEKLLKLWEGLGYYNRVRNMQIAAKQIMEDYDGVFPSSYDEILKLKGIGTYTAGAIAAFAFHQPKPAVDGNVLRVTARILADDEDIMKVSMKKRMESYIAEVIPPNAASDFNQGLIELGAVICVPNGEPKCTVCPVTQWCEGRKQGLLQQLPVKAKAKARKIEKRTVLIFKDGENIALHKRENKGLLAGLYELPNVLNQWSRKEVIAYSKSIGLTPIQVQKCGDAKHIFSHIEWQMTGYVIRVDELEKSCSESYIFVHPEEIQAKYPIPAAFEAYAKYLDIQLGQKAFEKNV